MVRETSPSATSGDLDSLVAGNSEFAFDLYRSLGDSGGNLFFSPYSISAALAMTYAGARNDTERQMAETLGFKLPQNILHPAFNALDLSLTSRAVQDDDEGFRLNIANSVWGQQDYGFLSGYLDTLAVNYGAQVRPVDFRGDPEDARARINDWVSDETEDRIKNLVPQGAITPLTRMVLANAIYFKAAWQHAFSERETRERPFHLLDGSEVEVPMMRQQRKLRYARGDGYQAVELPYVGGEVAMTILLPDSGGFGEFEESLEPSTAKQVLTKLDDQLVRLTMPKFETDSAFSLPETLAAMGMPDAFDGSAADFSGMDGRACRARGEICLFISDVRHKAFVFVDEAGTEAAAATAVTVGVTSIVQDPPKPIELVVDRPFVFLIQDRDTGTILFLGRITDPR